MATLGRCTRALTALLIGSLTGCGVSVPDIKEFWDADRPADAKRPRAPAAAQIEFEIKKRVFCELAKAVQYVNGLPPVTRGSTPSKVTVRAKYAIPLDWIAQISLSLQVDESSALSPGVTLSQVLPNAVNIFGPGSTGTVTTPQSRSLGLGGTLSSTATRIDKFSPSYPIAYLMSLAVDDPSSVCLSKNDPFRQLGWEPASSSPFILEGNLGIQDWLFGAMFFDIYLPSQSSAGASSKGGGAAGSAGSQKTDAVSYEIKFIIISSGNVTPTWKLVNISANTSGTLFAAGRTRTHDLIITIGPNDTRTLDSHLASEIGQAVGGANGARLMPQQ